MQQHWFPCRKGVSSPGGQVEHRAPEQRFWGEDKGTHQDRYESASGESKVHVAQWRPGLKAASK